jgi:type II pantothenate kinase
MADALAALPQLVVEGYRATTFDYDPPADADPSTRVGKEKWIAVFRASIPVSAPRPARDPRGAHASALARRFAASFDADLDRVASGDHASLFEGAPTVLKLCGLRDRALRDLGFEDCFLDVKTAENAKALATLPSVLREIDAIRDPGARIEALVRGVFAGNVFDLGAAASAARHADGDGGFEATRAGLRRRPWCVDHLDAFRDAWLECATAETTRDVVSDVVSFPSPWKKCVLFVDNAGADVVLGMLPLCRELLRGGAEVVLAANERPSINDVTARELRALLPRVAEAERARHVFNENENVHNENVFQRALDTNTLVVVSSGSDLPVIDLSRVSAELVDAARGADLVVLEGMGRGIETNLFARFACDALNLGMVKHPEVAQCLRGTLYDCVCRFARPEE